MAYDYGFDVGTGDAWTYWVHVNTGTSATSAQTWTTWNSTIDTGTGGTVDSIWYFWVDGTGRVVQSSAPQAEYVAPPRTPEQIAADEERRVARQHEAREREAAHVMASEKAQRLLASCLTQEQQRDLKREGSFSLKIGNKHYRIRQGYAGNVELLEDGRVVMKYCIHPREHVPDEDTMLAQKLLLEADEGEFLRVANASR